MIARSKEEIRTGGRGGGEGVRGRAIFGRKRNMELMKIHFWRKRNKAFVRKSTLQKGA